MTTAYTIKQARQIANDQPVTIAVRDGKGFFTPVGKLQSKQANPRRFTVSMYLYTESFATLSDVKTWVYGTLDSLGLRGLGLSVTVADNCKNIVKNYTV